MSGWDMLSEAPATDADHLQKLTEIAGNLQGGADAVAEYAQVCQSAGMDQRALGRLQNLAESLAEAGSHVGGAVEEFEQTYGPVRELAAAGVSIPGDEGKFWTGEGA